MSATVGSRLSMDPARLSNSFWAYVPGVAVPDEVVEARRAFAASFPSDSEQGTTALNYAKPGALNDVLKFHAAQRDASRTHLVAENAGLFVLRYPYHSNKPMEAWLDRVPTGGQLRMNLVITPSWHFGTTEAQMDANGKKFARTNVYEVEVQFPDGRRQRLKFDVNGRATTAKSCTSDQEVFATASPVIAIDLKSYRGQDIIIRAWPTGSAGVLGFREARETTLHVAA